MVSKLGFHENRADWCRRVRSRESPNSSAGSAVETLETEKEEERVGGFLFLEGFLDNKRRASLEEEMGGLPPEFMGSMR